MHLITLFKNSLKKGKISSENSWNYCINKVESFGLGCKNENSLTSGKLSVLSRLLYEKIGHIFY